MQNIARIVIFADQYAVNLLSNALSKNDKVFVLGYVNNIIDLEKILSKEKEVTVIFDVTEQEEAKETFLYFKNKKIQSLAVCKDINTGFEMLTNGASEMIVTNHLEKKINDNAFCSTLGTKILQVHSKYFIDTSRTLKIEGQSNFNKIIAIGSSTGGTESILKILRGLPYDSPPILIVQHMPPVFTKMYAKRMHDICKMSVWEAENGDELRTGLVLLAPGDLHMKLIKKNKKYFVSCYKGEKVSGHRPSADVLFSSVASEYGENSIGIILTGMGSDGAKGLLEMRNNGARTIGQNKESCVVYGMPKVAYEIGAVEKQMHLDDMSETIINMIKGQHK